MANEDRFLPLVVANVIELKRAWEEIARTPESLGKWLIKMLAVDSTKISALNEIVLSEEQPTGENSRKIWVAVGPPPFIAIPSGDNQYVKI